MFLTLGASRASLVAFSPSHFPHDLSSAVQQSAFSHPHQSFFYFISIFLFCFPSFSLPWGVDSRKSRKKKDQTRPDPTKRSRCCRLFFLRAVLAGVPFPFPFLPFSPPAATSSNKQQLQPKSEIPLVFLLLLLDHLLLLARSSFSFPSPSLLPILPPSLPLSLSLFGRQKALGTAYPSQVVAARFPFFTLIFLFPC